jgi:hypothetical protein
MDAAIFGRLRGWSFVCAAALLALAPTASTAAAPPSRADSEQKAATQRLLRQAERARRVAQFFRKVHEADQRMRFAIVELCEAIDRLLFGRTRSPLRIAAYNLLTPGLRVADSPTRAEIWDAKAASLYLRLVRRLEAPGGADHLGADRGPLTLFRAGKYLFAARKFEEALAVYQCLHRIGKTPLVRIDALGGTFCCQAALGKVKDLKRSLDQIDRAARELPAKEREPWQSWSKEARKALEGVPEVDEDERKGDPSE